MCFLLEYLLNLVKKVTFPSIQSTEKSMETILFQCTLFQNSCTPRFYSRGDKTGDDVNKKPRYIFVPLTK